MPKFEFIPAEKYDTNNFRPAVIKYKAIEINIQYLYFDEYISRKSITDIIKKIDMIFQEINPVIIEIHDSESTSIIELNGNTFIIKWYADSSLIGLNGNINLNYLKNKTEIDKFLNHIRTELLLYRQRENVKKYIEKLINMLQRDTELIFDCSAESDKILDKFIEFINDNYSEMAEDLEFCNNLETHKKILNTIIKLLMSSSIDIGKISSEISQITKINDYFIIQLDFEINYNFKLLGKFPYISLP